MSLLNSLRLTASVNRNSLSPVYTRRNKLISRLDEQIKLAMAVRDGNSYAPIRSIHLISKKALLRRY